MGKIITVDRNLGAQLRKEVKLKSGMFSGPYKVEISDRGISLLKAFVDILEKSGDKIELDESSFGDI